MNGLPFREVWAADFEYRALNGERPVPVCMVAKELRSGRLLRLWYDELHHGRPAIPTDDQSLLVAYYTPAELSCFLALGWPMPTRVLDLYAEFRAITNGLAQTKDRRYRSLLDALTFYGLPSITKQEKDAGRALALQESWTADEQRALIDYCETDVTALEILLPRMLPAILASRTSLGHALLRGRYTAAVARMEHNGVPIDAGTLARLRESWDPLKLALIEDTDRRYGVYLGTAFKADRFEAWVQQHAIPWPRLASGRLALDKQTMKDQAAAYPVVNELRELRVTLSELRLEKLAVGHDGRNRTGLGAFGTKTGRNTPRATEFIFGPSTWLRGLIKPAPGRALAYLDWSSQEVAIAAALSHDRQLLAAVESGDPYMHFAKLAGLVPEDATKASHPAVRALCKTCLLGSLYGMGAYSLHVRTGVSQVRAESVHRALARSFPTFWRWRRDTGDRAMLDSEIRTMFGWPMRVTDDTKSTTLQNWPMQSTGAEMMRLACSMATENGVTVCAPVHDALLIESPADELHQAIERAQAFMVKASSIVLNGPTVGVDAKEVRHPDRYMDEDRGRDTWQRVTRLLGAVEGRRRVA
jgi:DNA polymerase-1